jgi:hypothetical protein
MGLKKFFKKAGGWIKDKFHKAKNFVVKYGKPILQGAKKFADFIDKTPLKGVIDNATGGLWSIGKGIADVLIPDGEVKNNTNKWLDDQKRKMDEVSEKIGHYQDEARKVVDKGRDYYRRGEQAYHIIRDGTRQLRETIPRQIHTIP